MSEYAELRIYDPTGVTLRQTLTHGDYLDLSWSDEVGGGGGCSFTVPTVILDDATYLDDCVVKVAIVRGTTTEVAAYAVRGNVKTLTIGGERIACQGEALLTAWARDAVIRPESSGADMPRSAGDERGFGWMGSAYDPGADLDEPWDRCFESARATYPSEPKAWPAASGAIWISATGDADTYGNRKLARAWLTVTTATLYRCYFSSDETSTLWVAGTALIRTDDVEVGKKTTNWADIYLEPGTWAVAVDFVTHISVGGDGVDPFILAICELDDDGDDGAWVLTSNATDFVACRRFVTGSGSLPPGPTPGAVIAQVAQEAADRSVSTWVGLSTDFDESTDSDSVAWSTIEERIQRYAFDDYGALFAGLGDVACDMRITPSLVLQARVFEGSDLSATVSITPGENVAEESETLTPIVGNVIDSLTADGWITKTSSSSVSAYGRREMALSLGTAPSLSQGERITTQALVDAAVTRVDGDIEFYAQDGCEPYADFRPGDTVAIARPGGSVDRRILTLTGRADRPIKWSAELGEANL